jgi:hypothetical protein
MSKRATSFYVYNRTTGGRYLTERAAGAGYRWVKSRSTAVRFASEDTARRNARRYGGCVVVA